MYFEYGTITRYGVGFQQLLLYIHFVTLLVKRRFCLTTPREIVTSKLFQNLEIIISRGLGSSRFARRYLGNVILTGHFFLFLQVLRCFTSLGTLMYHLRTQEIEVYSIRFPHSEISGSKVSRHLPETYRRRSRLSSLCRT